MSAARVLVVDDEPLVLDFSSSILRSKGYQVVTASGPREALEIVRRRPLVDVMVSDIEMPEMAGTELVRQVARISPRTGLVLMTGSPLDSGEVPKGMPVISKPFSIATLISAVAAVLERSAKLSDELARARSRSVELSRLGKQLISECKTAIVRSEAIVRKSQSERERRQNMGAVALKTWLDARDGASSPALNQDEPLTVLTSREKQVLELVASGLRTQEIGRALGITFKTAACHRTRIMAKLDIHDAVGLCRYAVRQKLIEP